MAENAILEELRRDYFGLAILPRAWLTRLTEKEARETGRAPVGFPRDQRTLDQYLRKLEKWAEVVRIRSQDGGSAFCLREAWDALSPENRNFLRRVPFALKGAPEEYSIVLLGPGILPESLRSRVWSPAENPAKPGQIGYRCLPLMNLRHHQTGELVPETSFVVDPEQKYLVLVIGQTRPRGGKVRVEVFDDTGEVVSSGYMHPRSEGGRPAGP